MSSILTQLPTQLRSDIHELTGKQKYAIEPTFFVKFSSFQYDRCDPLWKKLFSLLLVQTDIFVLGTIIGTRTMTWNTGPFHLLLNFNILSNIKWYLPTAVSVLTKDSTNKLLNPILYFAHLSFVFLLYFSSYEKREETYCHLKTILVITGVFQ